MVTTALKEIDKLAKQEFGAIPVVMELPSDMLTPVGAYLKLRGKASKSFLLESANGGEEVGRYSFIGSAPFAHLTVKSGKLYLAKGNHFETLDTSTPFADINTYLQKFRAPRLRELPPFCGGAIGYVGYDAIRYLEKIPLPTQKSPSHEINLMLFRDVVVFDHLTNKLLLISQIHPAEESVEDGYGKAQERIEEMRAKLFAAGPRRAVWNHPLPSRADIPELETTPLMGREMYAKAVRKIKNYIKNGDIFQCVLSERFAFACTAEPIAIYRALRMANPSPYLFHLELGDEYLLGSSPEMLIRSDEETILNCPIAGTRPRGSDYEEDKKLEKELLASVKERAEHLMLVDLGRNDIGRVSRPGSVKVHDFMKVVRYSHVMHLTSLIEGSLRKNIDAWEALSACFPAGTLSGAPKIRAMEIISELESVRRGPYGGAVIAYDFSGNLNSCITIRSLYLKDEMGIIQAGAGIVADSRPDKEYDEVLNKAQAVKNAVAIASALANEAEEEA